MLQPKSTLILMLLDPPPAAARASFPTKIVSEIQSESSQLVNAFDILAQGFKPPKSMPFKVSIWDPEVAKRKSSALDALVVVSTRISEKLKKSYENKSWNVSCKRCTETTIVAGLENPLGTNERTADCEIHFVVKLGISPNVTDTDDS